MRFWYSFHLFVLSILSTFTCPAQSEIVINAWGKSHGLESTIIFGVFQDINHMIWICTYNGLYYFDGFRSYKAGILDGESNLPYEGIVNQIVQSLDGKYWLKLEGRLGSYDVFSKIFTPLVGSEIHFLSFFQESGSDLFVVEPQKRTFLVDRQSNSLVPLVLVDSTGNTISNQIGILGESSKFYCMLDSFPVEVVPSQKPGRFVIPLKMDSTYCYWNEKGYFKYSNDVHGNIWYKHPFERKWMVIDPLGKDVTDEATAHFDGFDIYFLITQANFSWFATDGGLIIWEKGKPKPTYLFEEFRNVNTGTIFNYFDTGGTIWSWNRDGMLHIRVKTSNFSSLSREQNGLFSNFILGIYPLDEKRMLVKHDFNDRYLSVLEKDSKTLRVIHVDELSQCYGFTPYINNGTHREQRSWILTHGEAIHRLFDTSPNVNPFTANLFISDRNSFRYVAFLPDHTEMPLQLWDIQSDKMVFPKIDPLQLSSQGDTVWIGTESVGLVALHTPTGKTAHWLADPADPSSIPSNRVHVIIPAAGGNLWLGTSRGLSYFDKRIGKFTTYRTVDGLIDDRIYSMVVDRKGLLWIGTGKGISRFDTGTKTFANFTKADGLINSEYNRNSAVLLDDGTILMGGMEGIDFFDPDEIEEELEKPTPRIAHIHNNDKLINQKSKAGFGYEENHFDFYVSADPIWMASTLSYQYKLDGADADWQSMDYSNVVHYPNLPSGKYRFHAKIANQPEIATYEFEIYPVWYKVFWFKLGYILSGLLIIYLLYRMLLGRHLQHLDQEKRVLALKAEKALSITMERERIIADLHDDIGATLSAMHIYGDLAGKVWDDQPERAKDMIDKIKVQSKDLMERMNDIVWSMKDHGEDSFIERVRFYAAELLSSKGVFFSDSIAHDVEALIREPGLRRSLLLIIKEALNNSAKHSQATKVNVNVYQKEGELVVKIKDDGRGIDLSKTKNGNGLGNIKYRCTKMKGKFTIKSQPGSGTLITCRIPLATISIATDTNSG